MSRDSAASTLLSAAKPLYLLKLQALTNTKLSKFQREQDTHFSSQAKAKFLELAQTPSFKLV